MKGFLARLFGKGPNATQPPLSAAQSAAADGFTTTDGAWYFAHPIHLEARMEHLVPSEDLSASLNPEEWQQLEALLNSHFEGDALHFHVSPGPKPRLYLHTPALFAFHPKPINEIIGRPIASHWPSATEARPLVRPLARLLNEIQMLLHEQPFNEAREARGEPPVNGLWLWDSVSDASISGSLGL